MGAAFAIQVMTGKENNVKKLMDWAFARNEKAQSWVKAVHTLTSSIQRVGKSGLGKVKEKPLMPGYVFIEMNYSSDSNNQTTFLPAELWHLVKGIPGVIRQFTGAGQIIGAEVFEELSGTVEEEKVEVAEPVAEQGGVDPQIIHAEKNVQRALHEVNMAKTPAERVAAEEKLDEAVVAEQVLIHQEPQAEQGPVADQLDVLKQDVPETKVTLLSRAKAYIKNQKEVLSLPKSLFMKYGGMLLDDAARDSDPLSIPDLVKALLQGLKQDVMLE